MLTLHRAQVGVERLDERLGQKGRPVLLALALTHDELQGRQIQIFDAQAHALLQPQARAVQQ
jgi:hypothetical protein